MRSPPATMPRLCRLFEVAGLAVGTAPAPCGAAQLTLLLLGVTEAVGFRGPRSTRAAAREARCSFPPLPLPPSCTSAGSTRGQVASPSMQWGAERDRCPRPPFAPVSPLPTLTLHQATPHRHGGKRSRHLCLPCPGPALLPAAQARTEVHPRRCGPCPDVTPAPGS